MRKILLATAAATFASGAALAADLPNRRAPPPIYPVAAPIFTWTGFYVGVNAGYAFNSEGRLSTTGNTAVNVANVAAGFRPPFVTSRSDGFTGGGQIGYNYQFMGTGFVVGAEADIAYTDLRRTTSVFGTSGLLNTYRTGLNYLGTVRGRVGYSFNQFLVYGTGGLAYGEVETRGNFYNAGNTTIGFAGSQSSTRTGYAVGGGVEYAIPTDSFLSFVNFFKSSAVTIKAEYLHYDLGRSNNTFVNNTGGAAVGSYTIQNRARGDLVRAGLNYKF